MSPKRAIVLAIFCFLIALSIVHLEAQKVGHARQIVRLNGRMMDLDYQHWQAQLKLAQLISPAQLRQRSEKLALGTIAPRDALQAVKQTSEQLASH